MPVVRGSTVLTLRPQRLLPSGCPNVEPRRGNRGGGIGKFTHKGQLSVGPGSVAVEIAWTKPFARYPWAW